MGQYTQEIQRVSGRRDFHTLSKANGRPLSPLEIIEKVKRNVIWLLTTMYI